MRGGRGEIAEEARQLILLGLSLPDILQCGLMNESWYQTVQSGNLWYQLYMRDYVSCKGGGQMGVRKRRRQGNQAVAPKLPTRRIEHDRDRPYALYYLGYKWMLIDASLQQVFMPVFHNSAGSLSLHAAIQVLAWCVHNYRLMWKQSKEEEEKRQLEAKESEEELANALVKARRQRKHSPADEESLVSSPTAVNHQCGPNCQVAYPDEEENPGMLLCPISGMLIRTSALLSPKRRRELAEEYAELADAVFD